MNAAANALSKVAESMQLTRDWTPDDLESIEDVLAAAVEVAAGRMPWAVAMNVGAIRNGKGKPSSGYTRLVAWVWATRNDDPRRHDLQRLIDTLAERGNGGAYDQRGQFYANGDWRQYEAPLDDPWEYDAA